MLQKAKILIPVLLVLAAIFLLSATAFAAVDDPESAAFIPLEELFEGKNSSPYLTEYEKNYHLDMIDITIKNIGDTGGVMLNALANVIFKAQKGIGKLIITLFYYAFELDIYKMFEGVLNSFVSNMKTSLFDQMAVLSIALLGIFFAVKLIQDQKTQVWIAILQTAIIAAIAIYFFTNPTGMLQQIDKTSKEISKVVLAGTYKATNNGATPDHAVVAAANQIWYIYVHQPWQMLEFGNISVAQQYEKQILSLPPSSDARKALVKDMAKNQQYFTADWGGKRLAFQVLYLIPLLLVIIVIVILCAMMIIYQFLTVFFAMYGAFVFLIALIPFFGIQTIQSWASKLIGFAGIKIIVTFCLGMVTSLISTIAEQSQGYGWIMTIFLECAIVIGIIWKKDAIFEAFTNMRLAPGNPSIFNKQLRRDINAEPKTNEISTKAIKGSGRLGALALKTVFRKRHEDDEDMASENEVPGSSRKEKLKSGKHQNAVSASSIGRTDVISNVNANDEKNNESDNFRQLLKKAEEILEQQYEILRTEAEDYAKKIHDEPAYPTFVEKVDTREELGAPRFEQREILSVAEELKKVINAGGSPEDLLEKGTLGVAKEPSKGLVNLMEMMEEEEYGKVLTVSQREAGEIYKREEAGEYSSRFNKSFNTDSDSEFMYDLNEEYDSTEVEKMIDRMEGLQNKKKKRGESFSDPKGYLERNLRYEKEERESMRKKLGDGFYDWDVETRERRHMEAEDDDDEEFEIE